MGDDWVQDPREDPYIGAFLEAEISHHKCRICQETTANHKEGNEQKFMRFCWNSQRLEPMCKYLQGVRICSPRPIHIPWEDSLRKVHKGNTSGVQELTHSNENHSQQIIQALYFPTPYNKASISRVNQRREKCYPKYQQLTRTHR